MPTTIPYDPSLVLGNIISKEKLDNLVQISELQGPVNAAEDTMNSYISMKRSIDMTIQDLVNMNIDPSDLKKESDQVGKSLKDAAIAYAKTKLDAEKKIQPLKAKINMVNESVESPIDYMRTGIKKMPLSADSIKMNCQYFSFDKNTQDSGTHAATIASMVGESFHQDFGVFGSAGQASHMASTVREQVNSQHARHSIEGTLVVSINCTHKNAILLAPFIYKVEKAVRVWNMLFPGDSIKVDDHSSLIKDLEKQGTKKDKKFNLISGATYGSCFVAMVHVLNTTDTTASQTMYSVAESLQTQFTVGNWFGGESGNFGVNSSFSNDAKNLLSQQNVTAHCTLVTMGVIPSIKSNEVKLAVEGFANFDGAKNMEMLAQMQNANAEDLDKTVKSAAAESKANAQMVNMENAKVKSCLSGLAEIDDQSNKIIDINSIMTALEDYVDKCTKGDVGIPINYYLKPVTKAEIVGLYLNKYYPNKYSKAMSAGDAGNASSSDSPASSESAPAAEGDSSAEGGSNG